MSYTQTANATFTITNARYLAAKVMSDLALIKALYGSPTDQQIEDYGAELTLFLNAGYLQRVKYGFKRNGNFIAPTLEYTVSSLTTADDDPRRVPPGADIAGASFSSYLVWNDRYGNLTTAERARFDAQRPFQRVGADEPSATGTWTNSKSYASGGVALPRRVLS